MLNQGSRARSSEVSHSHAVGQLLQRGFDDGPLGAERDDRVDTELDGPAGQLLQLVVGFVHDHVDARDHLRHALRRDAGEELLHEVEEEHVGRIAEVQELEVVLPALDAQIDQVVVVLQQVVAMRFTERIGHHRQVLHVGQARDLQRLELADGGFHLHLPLGFERVPVLVVVAGALHEVRHAAADLGAVLHWHRRDVDVAVDDAVVDATHRRHHEDAVVELRQREVPGFVPDGVERVQRLGVVQPVVEPEGLLLVRHCAPGRR